MLLNGQLADGAYRNDFIPVVVGIDSGIHVEGKEIHNIQVLLKCYFQNGMAEEKDGVHYSVRLATVSAMVPVLGPDIQLV